jgi:hypothetical protein
MPYPSSTCLHPQNTPTHPPPHGQSIRSHPSTTMQILVPVHLGPPNPNRPSQGHEILHLISTLHPSHQMLPSLGTLLCHTTASLRHTILPSPCHSPVGYPRSASPRIPPLGNHPRARTRIGTGTPIGVTNGRGHLISTAGRPPGKLAEIPTKHGRSITLQPSAEIPRSIWMRTICYRRPSAIGAIARKAMQ